MLPTAFELDEMRILEGEEAVKSLKWKLHLGEKTIAVVVAELAVQPNDGLAVLVDEGRRPHFESHTTRRRCFH